MAAGRKHLNNWFDIRERILQISPDQIGELDIDT
jgi:hypothetical protein